MTYPEQVTMIWEWLKLPRTDTRPKPDGTTEEVAYTYLERILAVRGDATGGAGDAPNEILQQESGLPMGEDSFFVFTLQGKNDSYVNFEQTLFKEPGDPERFSYPADHPLTSEFEEQMVALRREYKGDGEYLSVHHPDDDPNAKDDAPDSTVLSLMAGIRAKVGDILFLIEVEHVARRITKGERQEHSQKALSKCFHRYMWRFSALFLIHQV